MGDQAAAALRASRWEGFSDRLNPILVKEVRQSLRGRYFTVLFWMTLLAATLISAVFLVFYVGGDPPEDAGPAFFLWMYGCLSVAVHVFVPFSAYLSLDGERGENTYDLLVLSNLRPRQILVGKLLTCAIQVLLYYSSFGPFLAFALLLPGLDLVAAAWVLGLTLVSSLGLSTVALSLASAQRGRMVRLFQMVLLAVLLVPAAAIPIAVAAQLVQLPFIVSQAWFFAVVAGFLSTAGVLATFLFAYACTRLSHPEENRSTGLRVLSTLVVAVLLAWLVYGYRSVRDVEALGGFATIAQVVVVLIGLFFASEEERLGRRVRLQVPRNRLVAVLAAPYLPGGGRGLLLVLFHVAAAGLVFLFFLETTTAFDAAAWIRRDLEATSPEERAVVWVLSAVFYGFIYVGFSTWLFSRLSVKVGWRVVSRLGVLALAFGGFFLPSLAGYFLGLDDLWEHLGNPIWLSALAAHGEPLGLRLALVAGAAALVLVLNAARMVRGYGEVVRFSAERRARPASPASPGSPPPSPPPMGIGTLAQDAPGDGSRALSEP